MNVLLELPLRFKVLFMDDTIALNNSKFDENDNNDNNPSVNTYCFMNQLLNVQEKVKSEKYWTPRKIQNGKSLIKLQNQI